MAGFSIAYLIELKDKFTTVAKNVARNNKALQATFNGLKKTVEGMNVVLDKAKTGLRKFGEGAKGIGNSIKGVGNDLRGVSLAVAGVFWKSLKNWEEQSSAIATLENNLKSRQASLGMTSKKIQSMASDLQANSIFGDEAIIQNVTNQLLTFDKINGNTFKRANQAILDMTSKIYGANATAEQMRPMALALGKALNNPAEAMNSLGRVGVKFTAEQQKAVKQLVATGRSAKAQEFILRQLEKRYAGSAKTLGNTQPLKQLTNAFNDMLEPLGQIVQEFLIPLVKIATVLIGKFNNLPKPMKTFIVAVMGIIAIASPLLIILGGVISAFGSIATVTATVIGVLQKLQLITKIATAMQWLFNTSLYGCPIVWIIAGIIAVIAVIVLLVKNWDNVVKYLQFVWNFWKQFFGGLWQTIAEFATGFWQSITNAFNGVLQSAIGIFTQIYTSISATFNGVLQTVISVFTGIWQTISQTFGNIWAKVQEVFGAVKQFIQDNFITILLTALGPIGLIIQGIMKVKDLIGQIGSESIKVEKQIRAEDATSKNKVDVNGKIEVSASEGAKVKKTSSKTTSTAKGNVGFNLAKAGT